MSGFTRAGNGGGLLPDVASSDIIGCLLNIQRARAPGLIKIRPADPVRLFGDVNNRWSASVLLWEHLTQARLRQDLKRHTIKSLSF